MKTLLLYIATAIAEIVGCYLPLWLRGQGLWWVLLPAAALSLATFAWLLTLHAAPSGRVYAAYGGCLRRGGAGVAVVGGWHPPDKLGYSRRGGDLGRHGDYCISASNLRQPS